MPTVGGRVFRVAPRRPNCKPASSFWQFNIQGLNVYAFARSPSGAQMKLTVHMRAAAELTHHLSNRVHFRIGLNPSVMMAQPMALDDGAWLNAFELRFLFHPDCHTPPRAHYETILKKKFAIDVPPRCSLRLGLLIGRQPGAPPELPKSMNPIFGFVPWRSNLTDGRPVALLAHLESMTPQNQDALMRIWDTTEVSLAAEPPNSHTHTRRSATSTTRSVERCSRDSIGRPALQVARESGLMRLDGVKRATVPISTGE